MPERRVSVARNDFSQAFFAVFALVFTIFVRITHLRPRRPVLEAPRAPYNNRLSLSAQLRDADRFDGARERHARGAGMRGVDWKWLWTESATASLALCVAESATQLFLNSFARATHIHLALGVSRGSALLVIAMLVVGQVAASVGLLVPTVYLRTGSIAPSAALAVSVWVEAAIFGDAADAAFVLRCASLTATSGMLALFRFDRQARNALSQLPTSGAMLTCEASVRRGSTAACTGLWGPPLAVCAAAWSVFANPFWRTNRRVLYEFYRGRFQAGFAVSSFFFVLAAQDTRAHTWLRWVLQRAEDRVERVVDVVLRRKDQLLGQQPSSRPLGRKKEL